MKYRVLAINPGSTSTKIAVYDDDEAVFTVTLRHDAAEVAKFNGIIEQYEYRKKFVLEAMKENKIDPKTLKAVVGRGGLVKAVKGGTYKVNETMLEDLKNPKLWGRIHASSLGAFIANSIAEEFNIPAFIVDPVTVDEFEDIARISGSSKRASARPTLCLYPLERVETPMCITSRIPHRSASSCSLSGTPASSSLWPARTTRSPRLRS